MSLVEKIDALLLQFCTRFSHWSQRTTGRTNYFVAKGGGVSCFLCCGCRYCELLASNNEAQNLIRILIVIYGDVVLTHTRCLLL